MPDGVLFVKGLAAGAATAALFHLAIVWFRPPAGVARSNLAAVFALAVGLLVGCAVLRIRTQWPPANGLDRILTIVVPGIVGIELLAGLPGVPRWLAWGFRLSLSASIGRILLHNSVYVAPAGGTWTAMQESIVLGSCATLLVTVWFLFLRLADRSPGASLPLAMAEASLCGGIAIMLAGYLTGGKAALALAAALAGVAGAAWLAATRSSLRGAIGVGVVGYSGLLFVGRFFGGLSTDRALILLLSPLLSWVTELPIVRSRRPWLIGTVRLALVAVPLVAVVYLEKRDFDRHTVPLIGATSSSRFAAGIENARPSEPPGLSRR